jgi:protein-disulfide isomerase
VETTRRKVWVLLLVWITLASVAGSQDRPPDKAAKPLARVEVGYDPSRVRGDPQAPVTIVEFSDFQCPFCQKAYPVVKELLSRYEGRIKLAFRDFPLQQVHSQAEMAAEASRCALEQGKFWEYHDLLFSNHGKLDQEQLMENARTLKLDENSFSSCLSGGKFQSDIEKDLEAGTRLGVDGTPAFFINGVLLSGAQPLSVFVKRIEAELAAQARQHASK